MEMMTFQLFILDLAEEVVVMHWILPQVQKVTFDCINQFILNGFSNLQQLCEFISYLKLYILLSVSRRYFFFGPFMLFLLCVCYAFVPVCLHLPCGHLVGKG